MAQLKAIVDKLLTDVSVGYFPKGYIADSVLPFKQVVQSSGLVGKYGKEHLRIERSYTGGRGKYRRVEAITRSSSSYVVESHGLEGLVTEDDYRNVEQPFDAEKDETIGITTKIKLEKEKVLADAMTSTSTMTQNTTLAGTAQYSDRSNSDPIGDFATARQTIYDACGLPPNKAVIDWDTLNQLAYHPGILDALGYTFQRAGQLSPAELAKAMGVDQLLIGMVKYNSAKEGQTDSLASVWGKNIVFYYAPDSPTKYDLTLGLQVGYAQKERVFKFAEENPPNSTKILVDNQYQFLLMDVTCAYLIHNSVA